MSDIEDFTESEPWIIKATLEERYGEAIELSMSDLPERLRIHPEHLESAVRNLIDNAIRHGGDQPSEPRSLFGPARRRVQPFQPGLATRRRTAASAEEKLWETDVLFRLGNRPSVHAAQGVLYNRHVHRLGVAVAGRSSERAGGQTVPAVSCSYDGAFGGGCDSEV